MKLYHATYGANLESIFRLGLGALQKKNWVFTVDGGVCFADDMDLAISFCETAEDVCDEVYNSGIVCLEVDSEDLDSSLLFLDPNYHPCDGKSSCFLYRGVIAPEFCEICFDEHSVSLVTRLSDAIDKSELAGVVGCVEVGFEKE